MATHAEYFTTEYLKECFSYDPESGILAWKVRPRKHFKTERACNVLNARQSGKKAGSLSLGYLRVGINGKSYLVHRIAWKIQTGRWPKEELDHASGNRSDNRMANLREVTRSQNMRNAAISKLNTSGVTGVSWLVKRNKWRATIKTGEKPIHLGCFENKTDAVAARKAAEIKYGYHKNHGRAKVTQ